MLWKLSFIVFNNFQAAKWVNNKTIETTLIFVVTALCLQTANAWTLCKKLGWVRLEWGVGWGKVYVSEKEIFFPLLNSEFQQCRELRTGINQWDPSPSISCLTRGGLMYRNRVQNSGCWSSGLMSPIQEHLAGAEGGLSAEGLRNGTIVRVGWQQQFCKRGWSKDEQEVRESPEMDARMWTSTEGLRLVLQGVSNNLPAQFFRKPWASVAKRTAAVLKAKGSHSKYWFDLHFSHFYSFNTFW